MAIADKSDTGSITTKVYTVEPTGDITFIQAMLGGVLCTVSTTDLPYTGRIGEDIHLRPNEEKLHLFNTATGAAIV
jgi:multiple sugar transport system ATP-binding protein